MKKSTRRNKVRNPGLYKNYNLKIRHELLDQDYIDKLTPEEKEFLNAFNEEYVSAKFDHDGYRLHPKKWATAKVKKTGRRKRVDVYKRECEGNNNARNRDSFAIAQCNNMLDGEDKIHHAGTASEVEDMLIKIIDLRRKAARLLQLDQPEPLLKRKT